jgi:stearoyl-CoA desaturase (delta-9 desaturase)
VPTRLLSRREFAARWSILFSLLALLHAGAALAVVHVAHHGLTGLQVALFVASYAITCGGVTVGYHRLFTHRSFSAPRPVRVLLALCGACALQGSVSQWAADHRRHHRATDASGDPHSPVDRRGDVTLRGFLHSHCGWLFSRERTVVETFARDLTSDRALAWIDRSYPLWIALSLLLPAALAGAITGSWIGAWGGLLIGGALRVVALYHVTWSINSLCHIVGSRRFRTRDNSRNLWPLAIISLGESWHNNHHAFPSNAHHGLMRWELDLSGLAIDAMERIGLARDVRRTRHARIAERRAAG